MTRPINNLWTSLDEDSSYSTFEVISRTKVSFRCVWCNNRYWKWKKVVPYRLDWESGKLDSNIKESSFDSLSHINCSISSHFHALESIGKSMLWQLQLDLSTHSNFRRHLRSVWHVMTIPIYVYMSHRNAMPWKEMEV